MTTRLGCLTATILPILLHSTGCTAGTAGASDSCSLCADATSDASPQRSFSLTSAGLWGKNGVGGEGRNGAGSGEGEFSGPGGIALSQSQQELFVNDTGNGRIVVMSVSGEFLRSWPSPPAATCDAQSEDIAVGANDTVYVPDHRNHGIVAYSSRGDVLSSWRLHDVPEYCDSRFDIHPHSIAVDEAGHVYVVENDTLSVQVFDSDGNFLRSIGEPGVKGFARVPLGIAWMDGSVFVTDVDRVVVYAESGARERFIEPTDSQTLANLAMGIVAWKGWLFVARDDPPAFFGESPGSTTFNYAWETLRGPGAGQLNNVYDIAIDDAGTWYVSDSYNNRIQVFHAAFPDSDRD